MKHIPSPIQPQLNFDEVHLEYITLHSNAVDIRGQRFGRLIALFPVGRANNRKVIWRCQCDCGNTADVCSSNLRSKNSQSCGCLCTEIVSATKTTHGLVNEPLYAIWARIIQRCTNPKDKGYKNYGGRGISVCDEWLHDFKCFFDHVSKLPHCGDKGYSLDRIDNDGNYEPGNLRFATASEQQRNTRKNRMITHNGETKCLAEWAQYTGINPDALYDRLKGGWTVERTLSTPVREYSSEYHQNSVCL